MNPKVLELVRYHASRGRSFQQIINLCQLRPGEIDTPECREAIKQGNRARNMKFCKLMKDYEV